MSEPTHDTVPGSLASVILRLCRALFDLQNDAVQIVKAIDTLEAVLGLVSASLPPNTYLSLDLPIQSVLPPRGDFPSQIRLTISDTEATIRIYGKDSTRSWRWRTLSDIYRKSPSDYRSQSYSRQDVPNIHDIAIALATHMDQIRDWLLQIAETIETHQEILRMFAEHLCQLAEHPSIRKSLMVHTLDPP